MCNVRHGEFHQLLSYYHPNHFYLSSFSSCNVVQMCNRHRYGFELNLFPLVYVGLTDLRALKRYWGETSFCSRPFLFIASSCFVALRFASFCWNASRHFEKLLLRTIFAPFHHFRKSFMAGDQRGEDKINFTDFGELCRDVFLIQGWERESRTAMYDGTFQSICAEKGSKFRLVITAKDLLKV